MMAVRGVVLALGLFAACDTVEERPPSWSYVYTAVIQPSCTTAGCHSLASSTRGFDFSTRTNAYTMLRGITCDAPPHPQDPPGRFVVPFDPESPLLQLLRGTAEAPDGDGRLQMPPDQPIPAVEVELVERWIMNGAQCD